LVILQTIDESMWRAICRQRCSRGKRSADLSIAHVTHERDVAALIGRVAEPLPELDDPAFGKCFDRYGNRRVVLLGEASHGTSEFYRARTSITRRLVEEHGFTIVAAEADWPDAAVLDRYIRGRPARDGAGPAFQRFPTWMWRNGEFAALVAWLRKHNAGLQPKGRAGFYGLDLYNLNGSIRAVLDYLDRVDPETAAVARERYGCLQPWVSEPHRYGRMAITSGFAKCEKPVIEALTELLRNELSYAGEDEDSFLDAAQNARLVKNAEAYYRAMYFGSADSWNLRDRHMFETLKNVLKAKGEGAKAVVWAHNSHIGNARHTEMRDRGEINLGQLCRERFGEDAALIGFGTHTGTVAAATDWDRPMEVKPLNPSLEGSYERLSHDSGKPRFLLDLAKHQELRERLGESRLERFIGVIYRPETERWSHYMEASLPEQFDAWVWFDETRAVTPLTSHSGGGEEETWPTGL
jgi:erythromycin esterase-like protein